MSIGRSRSTSTHSRAIAEDMSARSSAYFAKEPKKSSDNLEIPQGRANSRRTLPPGEPIVTHGWTLTTACGFREVCVAIKESAFTDNDLPLIVSLEVHADYAQQEVMVNIMKEVWQGMLLDEAFEGCDPKFRVPKLDEVRNKILVKAKKAPSNIIAPHSTIDLPYRYAIDKDASDSDNDPMPPAPKKSTSDSLGLSPPVRKNAKVPICQALSDLAIYTYSEHFESLEAPQAKKPSHIFSISENRILELNEKCHMDIFKHNKSYFMRAFPAGRRIDSSNPDPSLFWRNGIQMVAMNWQCLDEGMMLNHGMFADEGGWVLKPSDYLSSNTINESQFQATTGKTMSLIITIFAAQHIPLEGGADKDTSGSGDTLRPLITAELHVQKPEDWKKDEQMHKCNYKQKLGAGKGSHPNFGPRGKTLSFLNIPKVMPELGFLR